MVGGGCVGAGRGGGEGTVGAGREGQASLTFEGAGGLYDLREVVVDG